MKTTIKILQSIGLILTITLLATIVIQQVWKVPETVYGYYRDLRARYLIPEQPMPTPTPDAAWMGITSAADMEIPTTGIYSELPIEWDAVHRRLYPKGYTFCYDCKITYKNKTATLEELFKDIK